MEHRCILGFADYDGRGEPLNECAITWALENGKFSMSAEVWNPLRSDTVAGGQCVDAVAALFPNDAKAQRMLSIWRRWHLNHMQAGSPAQMDYLQTNPQPSYGLALDQSLDSAVIVSLFTHRLAAAAEVESWGTPGMAPLSGSAFIAKLGLTMSVDRLDGPPPNRGWDADWWRCTFRIGRKRLTVPFGMGTAHDRREPGIAEVLGAIVSDAIGADESFETWAAEYSYGTNNREAEKIWRQCRNLRTRMVRFFESEAFETLQNLL